MGTQPYSRFKSTYTKQKQIMYKKFIPIKVSGIGLSADHRQSSPKFRPFFYPYNCRFSQLTGHYTQMLWWDTSLIGCGFSMFLEDGWWKKLYTCDYGSVGNIIFSQMYLRGAPCSSCPVGTTCSLEYPGLCGEYKDVPMPGHSYLC